MKKLIVFASFLFAFTANTKAQEVAKKEAHEKHEKKVPNTPEQRAQKSVDALNSDVVLTDDQKTKVKELALNRATKADQVRAKYKGQPENKEVAKKEIKAIQKEYHDKVKLLLTAEQLEKLKAKHKENKEKGKPNSLESND